MFVTGSYLLYPSIPHGLSFSENKLDIGTNDRLKVGTKPYRRKMEKVGVKLMTNESDFARFMMVATPPVAFDATPSSKLKVYNIYNEKMLSVQSLVDQAGHGTPSAFDRCTMIVMVDGDDADLRKFINTYRNFSVLETIIVIWNNLVKSPPSVQSSGVPVKFVRVARLSPNNRFQAWPQIQTDCILMMEIETLPSFEDLTFAYDVWKGHFFNHLVGFSFAGRNHIRLDGGSIVYSSNLSDYEPFYSMLLPAGLVLHRKYLQQYSELPATALKIVERTHGCEGLLLNIMVARAVGQGPVVLSSRKPISYVEPFGAEPSRGECLSEFSKIFLPQLPLQYSTGLFRKEGLVAPSLERHKSISILPIAVDCDPIYVQKSKICKLRPR